MTQPVEGSLPSPKGFSLGMRKVPPSTLNLETVTTSELTEGGVAGIKWAGARHTA